MPRILTAEMIAAITSGAWEPIIFLKLEFAEGDLFFWDGIGDLLWESDTYTGAGNMLRISPVTDTEAVIANDVEFLLQAVDVDIIETALAKTYQGRPITMWIGGFDSSHAIIADPFQYFTGSMDVMIIVESAINPTVSVRAESVLRALTRPSSRTWTPEDQKIAYPLDLGFDHLPHIQDDPLNWG